MKSRKFIVPLILLFGILNMKVRCTKQYPPTVYKYEFKENVSVTPYKLNYSVGDTIWLEMNIPGKKLFDDKTKTRIFFDSASLDITTQVTLIYNNPYIGTGPFASFIFTPGVSAYTQDQITQSYAVVTTGCTQSANYYFLIGIVLLEKGVFSIGCNSNNPQKCFNVYSNDATLSLSLNVDDTHKSYYQQLPFSDIGKQQDPFVLQALDNKTQVIINVQ